MLCRKWFMMKSYATTAWQWLETIFLHDCAVFRIKYHFLYFSLYISSINQNIRSSKKRTSSDYIFPIDKYFQNYVIGSSSITRSLGKYIAKPFTRSVAFCGYSVNIIQQSKTCLYLMQMLSKWLNLAMAVVNLQAMM